LTPRQESFCAAYIESGKANEAYKRTYSTENWKDASIRNAASRLMADTRIQAEIAKLRAPALARLDVTVDRITRELARIAFGDQRSLMTWDKTGVVFRDSETLSEDEVATVAEVSSATSAMGGKSLRLKTHDKLKALELLGKQIGMFKDKADDDGDTPAPIRVEIVTVDGRRAAAC
jgi:phage terminase small subunit